MSDQHRIAREVFYRERLNQRAGMSVGSRLDAAMAEAKVLAAMSAANLERHSPSADHDHSPPDRRGMLFDPEKENVYEAFARRVSVILHALEREVDAHKFGVAIVGGSDPDDQTTEERDRRLIKWVRDGLTPAEIAFLDPGQGSVRTIERQIKRLRDDEAL